MPAPTSGTALEAIAFSVSRVPSDLAARSVSSFVAACVVIRRTADLADAFARNYTPGKRPEWFDQIRRFAADLGFAPSKKVYNQDPEAYPGSIAEASQIVRVLITGSLGSPELADVTAALGTEEVLRRVRALR